MNTSLVIMLTVQQFDLSIVLLVSSHIIFKGLTERHAVVVTIPVSRSTGPRF
jgi:hypothetical protein